MTDTPALTAEQRAEDLCDRLSCLGSPDRYEQLALIASAIREAEDAAYERPAASSAHGEDFQAIGQRAESPRRADLRSPPFPLRGDIPAQRGPSRR